MEREPDGDADRITLITTFDKLIDKEVTHVSAYSTAKPILKDLTEKKHKKPSLIFHLCRLMQEICILRHDYYSAMLFYNMSQHFLCELCPEDVVAMASLHLNIGLYFKHEICPFFNFEKAIAIIKRKLPLCEEGNHQWHRCSRYFTEEFNLISKGLIAIFGLSCNIELIHAYTQQLKAMYEQKDNSQAYYGYNFLWSLYCYQQLTSTQKGHDVTHELTYIDIDFLRQYLQAKQKQVAGYDDEAESRFTQIMDDNKIPVFEELSAIQIKQQKQEDAEKTLSHAVLYFKQFGLDKEMLYHELLLLSYRQAAEDETSEPPTKAMNKKRRHKERENQKHKQQGTSKRKEKAESSSAGATRSSQRQDAKTIQPPSPCAYYRSIKAKINRYRYDASCELENTITTQIAQALSIYPRAYA